jgi:membrane-bound lytic murein transglycosylase D
MTIHPRRGSFLSSMIMLAVLSACVAKAPPPQATPRPAPLPERLGSVGGLLGEEIRPVHSGLLGPVSYDLPVEANNWVQSELEFLLNERRDVVTRWMERGDFYEGFVKSVFREHGIPTDLYHLAMIESGFIPTARSRAGAAGMWQFMPATSQDVALRVDEVVDERLDPVRSTRAAALHLRRLYRAHGDWALAAAAYNAGSGRIGRGIERFGARNFWDLALRGDLAEETIRYVPRLFAMTIIARDRVRFGFPPARIDNGFAFDSIHVDVSVPLSELAGMVGLPEELLASMNPHLFWETTPGTGYWLWVPYGAGIEAQRAFVAARDRIPEYVEYTVRWGDSLSALVQRMGVSSARIRELNPRVNFDRLQAGATIRLPGAPGQQLAMATPEETERRAESGAARPSLSASVPTAPATHRVSRGETLSEIASRYGVTVASIQEANSIRGSLIRSGQRLVIPPRADAGPFRVEHVVVVGDTLWELAQRYGSSIEAIQETNSLGGRPIRPGQKLNVPATRR